jgi:hypothetical protein
MQFSNPLFSWQNVALAAIVCLASLAFYRLTLHSLARFPGPKLAGITRYYEAYYDIFQNGQYTFEIAKMHQRYGTVGY